MARPRKTPGDRVVERLQQHVADALAGGDLSLVRFSPGEVERLELIRRVADDLDALERAWEADREAGRFTVTGSRNQPVANPLIGEVRATRSQLDRLVSGIKVDTSAGSGFSVSERARRAANARHHGSPDGIEQAREAALNRWGP